MTWLENKASCTVLVIDDGSLCKQPRGSRRNKFDRVRATQKGQTDRREKSFAARVSSRRSPHAPRAPSTMLIQRPPLLLSISLRLPLIPPSESYNMSAKTEAAPKDVDMADAEV